MIRYIFLWLTSQRSYFSNVHGFKIFLVLLAPFINQWALFWFQPFKSASDPNNDFTEFNKKEEPALRSSQVPTFLEGSNPYQEAYMSSETKPIVVFQKSMLSAWYLSV